MSEVLSPLLHRAFHSRAGVERAAAVAAVGESAAVVEDVPDGWKIRVSASDDGIATNVIFRAMETALMEALLELG